MYRRKNIKWSLIFGTNIEILTFWKMDKKVFCDVLDELRMFDFNLKKKYVNLPK